MKSKRKKRIIRAENVHVEITLKPWQPVWNEGSKFGNMVQIKALCCLIKGGDPLFGAQLDSRSKWIIRW